MTMTKKDATLLVVEDERAVRDSFVAYLEDSGYRVLEAVNGADGLAIFTAQQPDLVICDLRMPDLDGLQLLQRIIAQSEHTPVIVVSGAGLITDVVDALRLGAADYLLKPVVEMSVLEHAVERALDRQRLARQNRRYRHELEVQNQALQEHVDRLNLDLQAARAVQQRLLPGADLIQQGLRVRHDMQPSNYLSGDLVGYFAVSPHQFAFYMADVSGHGASSALMTLLIKTQIDRYRDELEKGISTLLLHPDQVLRQVNLELLKTETGKHATMFFGLLDTTGACLDYAMAAHFPPPILCYSDHCEALEPESLAVGLYPTADYQSRSKSLADFRQLLLQSDGILDLLAENSLAEKESRLLELAAEPPHTMFDFLQQARKDGKADRVRDDITVLIVERLMQGTVDE